MYPQQPQGWGAPPATYVPPKKKTRVGCIVSIVLAVVLTPILVVVGVIGYFLYADYSEPVGDPPTNFALPETCDLVSAPTLQRLRTTNPDVTSSEQPEYGIYNCNWEQTLGRDGNNPRSLQVSVSTGGEESEAQADVDYARESGNGARVSDVQGIGDEAVLKVTSSGWSGAELVFRKGTTVVTIGYHGSDKGFFSNGPIPEAESAEAVKSVAAEVEPKV
ncbi:hypothetical protein [Saccharopolyspora taberi]|uniref:hypothetical protein n=1 Tax=Saccharopolyspora taberi TaxID=60895 RepID=UPI0031CE6B0E